MERSRTAQLAGMAFVVFAARSAAADPTSADVPTRARELAERGRTDHELGNYPAAIVAFTEAYALAPSSALLFNLAQSYRMSGRCDDAATMYKRFLATDPPSDTRALAESQLIVSEQCATAGAPPRVAAAVVATRPSSTVVLSHRAAVERDVGIGLGIAGGVAVVTAAAFELRAYDAAETVSKAYARGGAWSSIAATDATGRHSAELADISAATGAVALGTAVALYWMGNQEGRARQVAVAPTSHGAEVHASWRF